MQNQILRKLEPLIENHSIGCVCNQCWSEGLRLSALEHAKEYISLAVSALATLRERNTSNIDQCNLTDGILTELSTVQYHVDQRLK